MTTSTGVNLVQPERIIPCDLSGMSAAQKAGGPAADVTSPFTRRLREALGVRGMSASQLERDAKLPRGEGPRLVSGERGKRPSSDKVEALARALDVRAAWLGQGAGEMGHYEGVATGGEAWRYPTMKVVIDYAAAKTPERWSAATIAGARAIKLKHDGQPTALECERILDDLEETVRNLEARTAPPNVGDVLWRDASNRRNGRVEAMRALALAMLVVACSSEESPEIKPDPAGTTAVGVGGSPQDSQGGAGGLGGSAETVGTGGAGGDTAVGAGAGPVSGSRLKAKTYVGDDGSREFAGWRDTERHEDCAFGVAEDGKTRCQPAATLNYIPDFYDASCRAQAVAIEDCYLSESTYLSQLVTACPRRIALHRVTSVEPIAVGPTYYLNDGICTESPNSPSKKWYAVEHVPASAFVEATIETAP